MSLVTEHLAQAGLRFEYLPHPRAETARAEAEVLDLHADEVVKVVVLRIDTGFGLAVLTADRRLDLDLAADAIGDRDARLATEEEIAAAFPEFEPGTVPPLPALLHVPVAIDPGVFAHRRVTFAAGSQRESVRTEPGPLLRGATVTIGPITAPRGGNATP